MPHSAMAPRTGHIRRETRESQVEVVLNVDGPSAPMSAMGGVHMGAEATPTINRKDFGVNGAPGAVGDDIQITLDVEMTHPAK